MHALPGRIRFRIPGKRGDRSYFEKLVTAVGQCSGLQRLAINPATASILIHYDVEHTGELNGFLEKNGFFRVIDRPKEGQPAAEPARNSGAGPAQKNEEVKAMPVPEISQMIGLGLIGFSCYRLLQDGFKAPAWHAALWYGYNLLRDGQPK